MGFIFYLYILQPIFIIFKSGTRANPGCLESTVISQNVNSIFTSNEVSVIYLISSQIDLETPRVNMIGRVCWLVIRMSWIV